MNHEEFQEVVKHIPRASTDRHVHILYGLIRWLRPKVVVEVGSWYGYSACWMARALKENGEGRLVCIDDFSLNFSNYETLCSNLAKCEVHDVVTVVPSKSKDFEWPKCDMAFIDGDHSFEGCESDVRRALGAGASCVVIHDTTAWDGPREVVANWRLTRDKWDFLEVPFDEGLSILMAQPDKPEPQYPAEQKELHNVR